MDPSNSSIPRASHYSKEKGDTSLVRHVAMLVLQGTVNEARRQDVQRKKGREDKIKGGQALSLQHLRRMCGG